MGGKRRKKEGGRNLERRTEKEKIRRKSSNRARKKRGHWEMQCKKEEIMKEENAMGDQRYHKHPMGNGVCSEYHFSITPVSRQYHTGIDP
jgi:hypothetical protein